MVCVLSGVAAASKEGSQRTRNPGKLDGSQETLRELELDVAEPAAGGAQLPETHEVGTTLRPRLLLRQRKRRIEGN